MALKKCSVGIHKQCVEIKAGDLRLAVTTKVGPRIIGCFIGDSDFNHFAVLPATPYPGVDNGFVLYGGHRLWHSPEEVPRTYEPDNDSVKVVQQKTGVEFICKPCEATGMLKKIFVEPLENGLICVTHTIENTGMWPVELAPWTLSQMAPGGTCIMPLGTDPEGYPFAPDRKLNFWPYTDLKDKRLVLGSDYIMVKSDPKCEKSLKIGYNNFAGWVAYVNNGQALVKYFDYDFEGEYSDDGCSNECYTCKDFTEMELLGAKETLEPGEAVQFVEYWQGIDGLPKIATEKDIAKHLMEHLLVQEGDCCCDDDCCCGEEEDDDCCDDDCCCGHHHHHGDCCCEDEEAEAPKAEKKKCSKKK